MSSIRTAPLLGNAVVEAAIRFGKTNKISEPFKIEPSDIKIESSDIFDATIREMVRKYNFYKKYLPPSHMPSDVISMFTHQNEYPSNALLTYLFTDDQIKDLVQRMPEINDTKVVKDFTWAACERAALSEDADEVLRASSVYSFTHTSGYQGIKSYADIISSLVEIAEKSQSNPFEGHGLTVKQVRDALEKYHHELSAFECAEEAKRVAKENGRWRWTQQVEENEDDWALGHCVS